MLYFDFKPIPGPFGLMWGPWRGPGAHRGAGPFGNSIVEFFEAGFRNQDFRKPDFQKLDFRKLDFQKPDFQKLDFRKLDFLKPDFQDPAL